jgi:hypothetical protein
MTQAQDEWAAINKLVDSAETDERIGRLFRSYVKESIHGGWDGFADRDVLGLRRMLYDLTIYAQTK